MRCSLEGTKHIIEAGLVRLESVRLTTEVFQKVCQIAMSVLQGINWYWDKKYLPKFIQILDVVNVQDFYEILKMPYNVLYQINIKRLDEYLLLESLEKTLSRNWKHCPHLTEKMIKDFAYTRLQGFLNCISEEDRAYHQIDEFKRDFRKWLLEETHSEIYPDHDVTFIDLKELCVVLKPMSILEVLSTSTTVFLNIGCVFFFLKEWEVLDLSFISHSMGRYSIFQWISKDSFGKVLTGGLCAYFAFQFLESVRVLLDGKATPNEKRIAWWDFAVSKTEFVFNLTLFINARQPVIIASTFVAKSIGLFNALYRPGKIFFEKHS